MKIRQKLVLLHRYFGLVMAGFLIITGLTGSLLVWYQEIDLWINQAEPTPEADLALFPLSPFDLRDRVEHALPDMQVNWMLLKSLPDTNLTLFFVEPKTTGANKSTQSAFNEVFVNRYTGEIVGKRNWGDITQGWTNFMPFVYRLHQSLTLGQTGTYILGAISLLWLIDCFTGLMLTFPHSKNKDKPRLKKWVGFWKVRWAATSYKITFDLHTALSLWAWLLLAMFALSSLSMTLYSEVYRPVVSNILTFSAPKTVLPVPPDELKDRPEIGWQNGYAIARELLAQLSRTYDFTVIEHERFAYYPDQNTLKLMARTSLDANDTFGQTWVFVDASTGQLKTYSLPTGVAAGDTFTYWLTTLHIARIWGLPYRVLVTLTGLFLTVVTLTGLMIWWRKHKAKQQRSIKK
ncbi:PepSY-associated TM helix domain-containing protein [Terasakiella pusilla]|uniref:PepSY-associated TM helix domain-containing protein n=1 Tax=Terasakiella pusilla TaxID=64973 RepID=UPI003AA84666